jgi:hypothetical protein
MAQGHSMPDFTRADSRLQFCSSIIAIAPVIPLPEVKFAR